MDNNNAPKVSLRSLSSLFCDAWKLYKERWRVLVEIVLLPVLVTILGYVLAGFGFPFSVVGGLVIFAGWILFMFSVLPVVFSIHHATGVDTSYKATIGWFWPFVWLTILEVLAVLGGWVMLIIPGIFLMFALAFMTYVFVIEHRRGIDALRQSKDYVKGYWWAVMGRVILLALLFTIAALIIELLFTPVGGRIAGSIASMVLVLFFIPFSTIYQYHIFTNLRELKPELAEAQAQKKEGTGFIKTSAIVGLVAGALVLFLLMIFLLVAASSGRFHGMRRSAVDFPPSGHPAQGSL